MSLPEGYLRVLFFFFLLGSQSLSLDVPADPSRYFVVLPPVMTTFGCSLARLPVDVEGVSSGFGDTYSFIRDVNFVQKHDWFKLNREMVYVLTGYGPINSILLKRGISDELTCEACGEEETVNHMIYDCELYQKLRDEQLEPDKSKKNKMIETEPSYKWFNRYTKNIFEKRNTYLLNIAAQPGSGT